MRLLTIELAQISATGKGGSILRRVLAILFLAASTFALARPVDVDCALPIQDVNGNPANIDGVRFYADGNLLAEEPDCSATVDVPDGTYDIATSTFNATGESALSPSRRFRVHPEFGVPETQSEAPNVSFALVGNGAGQLAWEADFEEGDMSEFDGFGSGGISVEGDGEAYEGTYYASRALANGSANDWGEYHEYGTPGALSSQLRNFWAQIRSSFDSFTGSWPSSSQKIFIFQFYDSTYNGGSFSNSGRKYQMILTVAGQNAGSREGEYVIELLEWDNEGGGSLVDSTFVYQNSTSYGPGDSFGEWDSLRLRVELDDNGSGGLGSGNGNGILQLWLNGEMIIDYTDVNFVDGNANVGMGRLLLSSKATDTWVGTATSQYWDEIQVSEGDGPAGATVLSAMANASVPRVAASYSYIQQEDYETSAGLAASKNDLDGSSVALQNFALDMTHTVGAGYGGTNCFVGEYNGDQGEDVGGWWIGQYGDYSAGVYDDVMWSSLVYMSSDFVTDLANTAEGHKLILAYTWDAGGSTPDAGRWASLLKKHSGNPDVGNAFTMSINEGGGGTDHWNPYNNGATFDWQSYADQWVWFGYRISVPDQSIRVYIATADDAFQGLEAAPYLYVKQGGVTGGDDFSDGAYPVNSISGAEQWFAYWETLGLGSANPNAIIKVDKFRISQGYHGPTF